MRRACFLVDRFYGPTAIERRARLEVRALVDAGAEVTVVTALWDDPHDDLADSASVELVEVRRRGQRRSVTQALWLAAASAGPVRGAITGADLLVSHGSPSLIPALPLARHRGVPTVFVAHSLIQDRIRSGDNPHPLPSTTLYRATDRLAARFATNVVGVSRYIADVAVTLGATPSRTSALLNPVDVERFRPGSGDEGYDTDVLFVGRLTVDKGIDDLLAAAAVLGPDVSVTVVGPGTRRAALEAAAPPHVRFLGRVDNDLLPAHITRARLLAVPSRNEPQGVAVLEGLACGTPVVGCRVGGIPEMVEHGVNGWLVPPRRPDALADAIRSALADPGYPDVRVRARASAERFAAADFPAAVVALYERLVRSSS